MLKSFRSEGERFKLVEDEEENEEDRRQVGRAGKLHVAAPRTGAVRSRLFKDDAVFHYEAHIAQGVNVRDGVASYGDEIGEHAWADRADFALHMNYGRIGGGSREKRSSWAHSCANHPFQFPVIRAMHENSNVAADADNHTVVQCEFEGA